MSYERVYAGETPTFDGVIESAPGVAIPKVDLTAVYLGGVDAATGAIVNGRNVATNIMSTLAASGITIGDTNGAFQWKLSTADTEIVTAGAGGEEHQFELRFITNSTPPKTLEFRHRIHCAEFLGLTSIEEMALQLEGLADNDGVIPDSRRFFIELMIDAVTARMERECDREFLKPATATAELCGGYEQRWLALRRWPVTKAEITSIKEARDGDFDAATAIEPTAYQVTPEGLVIHLSRNWADGPQSVQVVHKGGLARYVGAVPADLRYGATRQVATWWQRRNDLGVSGKAVQGANVTLFFQGGLVEELKALIPHYRRRVPVL